MRRVHRLALIALLIGAAPAISGCADFDLDKLDVLGLNKKKPLPGERHAVFPEGVPGVQQGIPPELMMGANQQAQPGAAIPADAVKPAETKTAAVVPPAARPKPKPKPKPKQVVETSRPTRIKMAPQDQPGDAQPAAAPAPAAQPAPPAGAPPQGWPAPAQSSAPWPEPPPSGTFSKQ